MIAAALRPHVLGLSSPSLDCRVRARARLLKLCAFPFVRREAVPLLAAELRHPNRPTAHRLSCALVLGRLGSAALAGAGALRLAAERDESSWVRAAAARALGRIHRGAAGSAECDASERVLVGLVLFDAAPPVRDAALEAIALIHGASPAAAEVRHG